MSQWHDEVQLHKLYQEARGQRTSYFEKLAILNGGTVALVITAVLGPLHGTVRHKYILGTGLTFLVAGMLALLRRNLQASHYEFRAVAKTARDPAYLNSPEALKQAGACDREIYHSEVAGVLLSAAGILLLLIEIWLILIQK